MPHLVHRRPACVPADLLALRACCRHEWYSTILVAVEQLQPRLRCVISAMRQLPLPAGSAHGTAPLTLRLHRLRLTWSAGCRALFNGVQVLCWRLGSRPGTREADTAQPAVTKDQPLLTVCVFVEMRANQTIAICASASPPCASCYLRQIAWQWQLCIRKGVAPLPTVTSQR